MKGMVIVKRKKLNVNLMTANELYLFPMKLLIPIEVVHHDRETGPTFLLIFLESNPQRPQAEGEERKTCLAL
jgi:hypothetical protein